MKQHRILLLLLILLSASSEYSLGQSPSKPNILFILTDDQGYGDVGRHGHPLLKTPHMDALHDQSVRLEKFYVSPSCSPTRAALLTGMHEFRSGVTHTTEPREHMDVNAVILPQLLKSAGYRTGFIGKWHLGNNGPYGPANRGFDWCSTNAGAATVHFDPIIIRNRKREKRTGYREDILFDEAMTFIDEAKGSPFFCYLATYSPHAPVKAPDEFKQPFAGKVDAEEADFLGMVANLDYNLGRITNHLKDRGLEKDTVIIWMNDNGEKGGGWNGLEQPASALAVPYHLNVSMGWDSSPRCPANADWTKERGYPFGAAIVNNTPENFRGALLRAKELTLKRPPSERIITINSWNEWGEGSYLEPDAVHGMKYLEAVREVFSPIVPKQKSNATP